ncbi:hypothetical protein V5799_015096, partial [Amblyomma americanum]
MPREPGVHFHRTEPRFLHLPQRVHSRDINECEEISEWSPCGANAQCRDALGNYQCLCAPGYTGNPRQGCSPIHPCVTSECGPHAYCEPKDHKPTCWCQPGYEGDPYDLEQGCQSPPQGPGTIPGVPPFPGGSGGDVAPPPVLPTPPGGGGQPPIPPTTFTPPIPPVVCRTDHDCGPLGACVPGIDNRRHCIPKLQHECLENRDCGERFECKLGTKGVKQCRDVCEDKTCGKNAVCLGEHHKAICECLPGFIYDGTGCQVPDDCAVDQDCLEHEACRHQSGGNKCVDVCLRHACGPNAKCIGQKHVPICVCRDSFLGNPNDRIRGCQPLLDTCIQDADCAESDRCLPDSRGIKNCTRTCLKTRCGPNAHCVGRLHRPVCECREGYNGNPSDPAQGCTPILRDRCHSNLDCKGYEVCKITPVGIKDCIELCLDYECGPNANCIAMDHLAA